MARIVGIGELLWDIFDHQRRLGGAPANFAFHAAQLGHQALIVSRVGNDQLGRELIAALEAAGLSTAFIQIDPTRPTGTVQVTVAADGSPDFLIHPDVAWDRLEPTGPLLALAAQADAVCFGTLAQRSAPARLTISRFLGAASNALKVFDINLRQQFWSRQVIEAGLACCHILKLNQHEQSRLRQLFGGPDQPLAWARDMIRRFRLRLVCITRAANGCLLVSPDHHADHPGIDVQVADTVGAGDAFTAALVAGYLAGRALPELAELANRLGAYVASQPGATPALPASIRQSFSLSPHQQTCPPNSPPIPSTENPDPLTDRP